MKLKVNMREIEQIANNIDSKISEFVITYMKLNIQINNMKHSWRGADNQAYINKINSYNEYFNQLTKVLSQYTKCMSECVKDYSQTQQRLMERAKSITKL